jgi:hypothetical protein
METGAELSRSPGQSSIHGGNFKTAGLYRGHCACTASLEEEILVLPYTLDMVEHMERG